jgi:NADH-quinone oxidoreductase subunit L
LIFVEIAAGLENLALLHCAGNAFLRATQLLVSPSIVSQRIGEYPRTQKSSSSLDRWIPQRLWTALYMLNLKEWGLDFFMYRYLWSPLKRLGAALGFLTTQRVTLFFVPAYLAGAFLCFNGHYIPLGLRQWLPTAFSFLGLIMAIKSFSERKNVWLSWILIITNHFWVALAVSFNESVPANQLLLYLSGVIFSGATGYWCLSLLRRYERHIGLGQFHGHIRRHERIGIVFFLSCLGLSGFPITPTFIGEDLVFSHIHQNQAFFAVFVSLGCIVNGISLIRIYARIFLGPGMHSQYELTYRSS